MKRELRTVPLPRLLAWLTALTICCALAGLAFGSVSLSPAELLCALAQPGSTAFVVVRDVRLPRVLGGLFAGAGLSCAGVLLQGVLNNPLAGANTIGVTSGAGFAVMLALVLVPGSIAVIPAAAFLGALAAAALVFAIACAAEPSRVTIILAGVTISSILGAGMNVLKLLNTGASLDLSAFLLGSLSGLTLRRLAVPLCLIALALGAALCLTRPLALLGLGDAAAGSLGLQVPQARGALLVLASVLAGAVVSYAGLLGFVGLIVPHICRRLFGGETARLMPCCALFGAGFVVVCDLLARTLFAPFELPVGILMALTGGPFFLYLTLSRKGRRRLDA